MVSWLLTRAVQLQQLLADELGSDVPDRLGIDASELRRWEHVATTLHLPFHQGVLSQFDGYERLEPFDLAAYRARYGDIGRLDLILEAEDDAVNRYQVAKQADVLMLLYLLSAEELRTVLGRLGHPLSADTIRRTIAYYTERVTHGSTLSNVVHAWVLARADRPASWQYFQAALGGDMARGHNGSTREGIHLGAMAGTVDILQRCYAGLEVRDEALWFNPLLPAELDGLQFDIRYRHNVIGVDIDQRRLRLRSDPRRAPSVTVMVAGEPIGLRPGRSIDVEVDDAR
jgi:trehalose/maltose hydrolase-like predicted phosphorylase